MDSTKTIYPLVLLGGGHSHVLWLKSWQDLPIESKSVGLKALRPLLVSENSTSPYSGMLPGLLAGQYQFDDCHINLEQLCKKSQCDFLTRQCINIQTVDKPNSMYKSCYRLDFKPLNNSAPDSDDFIYCEKLSINIGSQPFSLSEPDDLQTSPYWKIKPISQFFNHWQRLQQHLNHSSQTGEQPISIRVTGAGAAGVEIASAIKSAHPDAHVQLISKSEMPLPKFNPRVQKYCLKQLQKMGIEFIAKTPNATITDKVGYDILCTHSAAPKWLLNTALDLSEDGFINVNHQLETSLPGVFAAGDCLHFNSQPLAKAGVYAVRQAPTLFHNLCASINQSPLQDYQPQSQFLSIINMGNQYAIGQRGKFSWHGRMLWHYKHYLDQSFMSQFL